MRVEKFEDIIAWQKSKDLTEYIYKVFRDCRDYSYKDQIQRASVSIMNNIAEGFERKGDKELKHFLFIAKGSCAEVRSMSYLAKDQKYLNQQEFDKIYSDTVEIPKILSGFIKTL